MVDPVAVDFERCLGNGDSAPIAAIKALTLRLENSEAETVMGITNELSSHAVTLKDLVRDSFDGIYSIPVEAACDMFLKRLIRGNNAALVGNGKFDDVKSELVRRGKVFSQLLVTGRRRVADFGHKFIIDGQTVLVHGYSRAIMAVLERAAAHGTRFDVVVTEARPDCAGYVVARKLVKLGISHTIIVDAAIGYAIDNVDVILIGAEAILENGGITNRVGTYPLAALARASKTPVYVCAESFKFSRVFPLSQSDVVHIDKRSQEKGNSGILIREYLDEKNSLESMNVKNVLTDYTPPEFISLIVTELGVLTPSAVSDELIKLYQ